MARWVPLGSITFDGTGPHLLTQNLTASDPRVAQNGAHKFLVQHLPDNKGDAYVGTSLLNTLNYDGVLAVLPAPASATGRTAPVVESPHYVGMDGLDVNSYYADGLTGDTVIVSLLEA